MQKGEMREVETLVARSDQTEEKKRVSCFWLWFSDMQLLQPAADGALRCSPTSAPRHPPIRERGLSDHSGAVLAWPSGDVMGALYIRTACVCGPAIVLSHSHTLSPQLFNNLLLVK